MKTAFFQFVRENKAWLAGACVGLVLAVLFLTIGFFPTLLIAICTALGAIFIGLPNVRERIKTWVLNLISKYFRK